MKINGKQVSLTSLREVLDFVNGLREKNIPPASDGWYLAEISLAEQDLLCQDAAFDRLARLRQSEQTSGSPPMLFGGIRFHLLTN